MEANKEIIKHYKKDNLTVIWKPDTCIHSKKCWKELLQVFDPRNRPWVNLEGATIPRIKKQVDACPSKALSYIDDLDKNESEQATQTEVECIKNGPLMVKSDVHITHSNGDTETREKLTAFCRCGASNNKPFCDGTHNTVNFIG